MKFYNIKLRLSGNMLQEVRRQNVSTPEVMLLNAIHGGAAVVELTESGGKDFTPRDHRLERRRLEVKYGEKEKWMDAIRSLFGGVAGMLPESTTLDDLAPIEDMAEDLDAPFQPTATPLPDPAPRTEAIPTAKETLRANILKMGGSLPPGNVSESRLRSMLGELQLAKYPPVAQEGDDAPKTADVLGE